MAQLAVSLTTHVGDLDQVLGFSLAQSSGHCGYLGNGPADGSCQSVSWFLCLSKTKKQKDKNWGIKDGVWQGINIHNVTDVLNALPKYVIKLCKL